MILNHLYTIPFLQYMTTIIKWSLPSHFFSSGSPLQDTHENKHRKIPCTHTHTRLYSLNSYTYARLDSPSHTFTYTHMHAHLHTDMQVRTNADSSIKVIWQDSLSIHLYSGPWMWDWKYIFWALHMPVNEQLDGKRPHDPSHAQGIKQLHVWCAWPAVVITHAKLATAPAGIVTDSSTWG